MALAIENHPCFNDKARHEFARVHLPVAPRCNIQCRYCNRRFDCVNESRPGVSCAVLKPAQALDYLDRVMEGDRRVSVVGIAGPGDPMANPDETMTTLRGVRDRYPGMLLCLATNGLALGPYVEELASLKVSHVTVTMNAVDPEIGEKFYAWVRAGVHIYRKRAGAERLLERQLEAIRMLKQFGVTVKINTILAPGVNDRHIGAVAEKAAALGASIFNCIGLYPVAGSEWSDRPAPDGQQMADARKSAVKFIPQMFHCSRCRADAAGLIDEQLTMAQVVDLQAAEKRVAGDPTRPCVAVASHEGILVNQHLGEAEHLWIFRRVGGAFDLMESRATPAPGAGDARWEELATWLGDCRAILISGLGQKPRQILERRGVQVIEHEGLVKAALEAIFGGRAEALSTPPKRRCGEACGGAGGGCA